MENESSQGERKSSIPHSPCLELLWSGSISLSSEWHLKFLSGKPGTGESLKAKLAVQVRYVVGKQKVRVQEDFMHKKH